MVTHTRWILAGLVTATFLSLLHYLSFSPLLPSIASDLQVDVGLIGQIPAAVGLGAAAVGLVAGPLADAYGKRRTLLLGLAALVLSAAALALVHGPLVLVPVAVLAAVGRATVYPIALAIASAEFEGEQQRSAISRVASSLAIAPIVGVPLVTAVAAAFNWRAAWLVLALVTALTVVWLYRLLGIGPAPAVSSDPRVSLAHQVRGYRLLIRHRPSLALVSAIFLMSAGGWAVWTYLGAFLIREHGFTTQEAGWGWTIVGVGLLGGNLLTGGRLGRLPLDVLFAVAAVAAGLCLGLAFLTPVSGWVAVAVIAVGTLLHGATQVVSAILLPKEAPTGRAATMTLRGAASSLGSAAGAALGGVLLETAGYAWIGVAAVAFCGLAAGVAWWGGMRVEQPAPRSTAPLSMQPRLPKAA